MCRKKLFKCLGSYLKHSPNFIAPSASIPLILKFNDNNIVIINNE